MESLDGVGEFDGFGLGVMEFEQDDDVGFE
jgi:hypothetical protein